MSKFDTDFIRGLQDRLNSHPIYAALRTTDDLRVFMQHHVYSVWDFMSLIKYLQHNVAPARWPWIPGADASVARFINELVLEEETDEAPPGAAGFASHFELYLGAMREIGADTTQVQRFIELVRGQGLEHALANARVPESALRFTRVTFGFIDSGRPHAVAAALALGREHVIPAMFRAFLARMAVTEQQAPTFHYYLNRHIHLDEDFHAPLSLRLLDALCGDDAGRRAEAEAEAAAVQAIEARLAFWDGVLAALPSQAEKKEAVCPN
ncbi:DUF3050 domain-containing protein [Sulfuritortus calidifontis]|nr:DUF3050 domain-containing protein [Sulfuritortus calidifontis]